MGVDAGSLDRGLETRGAADDPAAVRISLKFGLAVTSGTTPGLRCPRTRLPIRLNRAVSKHPGALALIA